MPLTSIKNTTTSATITTSAAAAAAAAVAAMFPGGLGSLNPKETNTGLNQMSNLGGIGSPLSNLNLTSRSSTGSYGSNSIAGSSMANPLLSLSSLSPHMNQSITTGKTYLFISQIVFAILAKFMFHKL